LSRSSIVERWEPVAEYGIPENTVLKKTAVA
jgi:hypothetical protein